MKPNLYTPKTEVVTGYTNRFNFLIDWSAQGGGELLTTKHMAQRYGLSDVSVTAYCRDLDQHLFPAPNIMLVSTSRPTLARPVLARFWFPEDVLKWEASVVEAARAGTLPKIINRSVSARKAQSAKPPKIEEEGAPA